ncbi:hypothetical protein JCM3774_003277 [Rhodotorula dairenensis]
MHGDDSLCEHDKLVATGSSLSTSYGYYGFKRDGAVPTGATCAQDESSGSWWCGIQGATCTDDACCDNGRCVDGQCTGGYDHNGDGDNSQCSGYLWCTSFDGSSVGDGTCGCDGAYCKDWDQWDLSQCSTDEERWERWDHNCKSGYCNSKTGSCGTKCTTVGCDCTSDPKHACGEGLIPVTDAWGKCTCQPCNPVSQRARTRRNLQLFDQFCPKGLTACTIGGSKGFECVDTLTNLEQCGACASSGGVDCTQLPGVASVACVEGSCEVWACEDGLEYDPEQRACLKAL